VWQHRPTRRGFTLVELLVVIAIIGILVALLLPAIQAAREAARRSSCQNNLKNLSLACLNHHDSYRCFPRSYDGFGYAANAQVQLETGAGWIVAALPFLEEQALYDQFKITGALTGRFSPGMGNGATAGGQLGIARPTLECRALMKTPLTILRCPSDPNSALAFDQFIQWKNVPVTSTNYKGCAGDSWVQGKWGGNRNSSYSAAPQRGILFRTSYLTPVKISQITDGTSHTYLVGEDVPDYNWHSVAFYSNGSWMVTDAPLNYLPDPPTPDVDHYVDDFGFRSLHPGGAHFAMADGSVNFYTDTISYDLYQNLSTKSGGEQDIDVHKQVTD
jgi:prepilin-type N-terminal cleavage/methylation domain-containing protein/prepilin-type processing-associated H-X9-DG protein